MAIRKVGLILPGGSLKGAWQAGYLKTALANGLRVDEIYGVSVGALNGALFTCLAAQQNPIVGIKPINTDHIDYGLIGKQLSDFWLDNVKDFASLGESKSKWNLILDTLRSQFSGLINMDPLDNLVHDNISKELLATSPILFECQTVNLYHRKNVVVEQDNPDIVDFILASSRIPITMPVKWIGGQPYADGGIRDIAPLRNAIKSGCTDLIILKPQNSNNGEIIAFDAGNIMQLTNKVLEIVLNEILENDLEKAETINELLAIRPRLPKSSTISKKLQDKVNINIYITEPSRPLNISLTKISTRDIRGMIDLGSEQALEESNYFNFETMEYKELEG